MQKTSHKGIDRLTKPTDQAALYERQHARGQLPVLGRGRQRMLALQLADHLQGRVW